MLNPEDIIKLAREAGLPIGSNGAIPLWDTELERFARAAYERGRLDENEACAVAAWSAGMDAYNNAAGLPCDARETGARCAAAIRARRTSTISPATLIDPRGSLGEPIL